MGLPEGKKRYLDATAAQNAAVGSALQREVARHLRDKVGHFQAVRKNIRKYATPGVGDGREEVNAAIRQIVPGAIISEGVIDVFQAAGLARPDISTISDRFLETVHKSPHRNLQIELLKKLLNDEIQAQGHRNVVQARKFSENLERSLAVHQNRTLEAAQVILELIQMAKEFRDAPKRGDELGLTEDELAFCDALTAPRRLEGSHGRSDAGRHRIRLGGGHPLLGHHRLDPEGVGAGYHALKDQAPAT